MQPPGRSAYTPGLFLNNFLLCSSHSLNDQQFFSCSPTKPSLSLMTSQLSFVPFLRNGFTNFYFATHLNNLQVFKITKHLKICVLTVISIRQVKSGRKLQAIRNDDPNSKQIGKPRSILISTSGRTGRTLDEWKGPQPRGHCWG